MIKTLGGRKFILAFSALICATVLCIRGDIHEGVYSAIVLGTVAAYITGNVTQKSTIVPEIEK